MTITAPHPGLPSGAFLIGDERLDEASGGWYNHVNPTTGLVQNRIPIAGTSEVDVAVDIARRAFPAWRAMEPNVRRNLLLDLADMSLANLVRAMIIRYRKGWLRGDSPGASSHQSLESTGSGAAR